MYLCIVIHFFFLLDSLYTDLYTNVFDSAQFGVLDWMGCRGCYGPLDGVEDQGMRMLTAIASVLEVGDAHTDEHELERQINEAMATIPDPAGTFYRFSMAHSILRRAKVRD